MVVEDVKLFNIYSGFLKILKILDFIATTRYFFPKKLCFWNFWGQKLKISKIRDSHLLDLFKNYLLCRFLVIRFTNVFLTNFQTFIFFTPKLREVMSQNRLDLNFFFLPESDFLSPDDVELMSGESCQDSCRYRLWFRSYSGKTEGGGAENAPRRLRVNIYWILWPDGDVVLFSVCDLYS